MQPPEQNEFAGVHNSTPEDQAARLSYLEARVRALEERIPSTRLLHRRFLPRAFAVLGHYLVAGLIVYAIVLAAAFIGLSGFGSGLLPGQIGEAAVPEGPRLESVASLPVGASGLGTLRGAPTGEATIDDSGGSFVLVLEPAPAGLPARTTLDVVFDRSTEVYRDGQAVGDPVTSMNAGYGDFEADPTAAGTVVVRFRNRAGLVYAERVDLSDEFPPGLEPE